MQTLNTKTLHGVASSPQDYEAEFEGTNSHGKRSATTPDNHVEKRPATTPDNYFEKRKSTTDHHQEERMSPG